MTAKQQRFIDEYVRDGNGSAAARRAGYAEKTAHVEANRLLKDPDIQKAIQERFDQLSMSAEEATKRVTDIARSSINDYLNVDKVYQTPLVRKPLAQLIAEMDAQEEVDNLFLEKIHMLVADELYDRAKGEVEAANATRTLLRARYAAELELYPDAYRDEKGTGVWVDHVSVDLVALVQDKERGRIKKFKRNEFGPEIELYDAQGALETILKIHGKLVQKHEVDHGFTPVDTSGLTPEQVTALLTVSRQTNR